jgi:hypothetical protein
MDKYSDCSIYYSNLSNVKETLNKYGVAIIPSLLDDNEIKKFREGGWNYLEHITQNFKKPIKRDDPKSWRSFYDLSPLHSMLVQAWNIGQAQFNWDLRQNEKILNVFSTLWNVNKEDLLTSFDGASFHFPPEKTNRGWYRKSWLHCDQSFSNSNFECIQSWVNAYPINKGDATLEVLVGSHKHHANFAKKFKLQNQKIEWYKLTDEQVNYYLNDVNCKNIKISCPAGSMVLWDSRTIHCGTEPLKTRDKANLRLVSYICMTPRAKSTPANIKKRIKAYEELRTTTHVPHKTKLFPKGPRYYGGPQITITPINKPNVTEIGKKIIGY